MLFKIFGVDETSKTTAFRVAVFNLILTFFLTVLLGSFIAFLFHAYDEETAHSVSRLVWVEITFNFLFYPFAIALTIGVKKDKFRWINIWVRAKVLQAAYIFLLNLVIQVYVTQSLDVGDGLVVLIYTLVLEVFYLEIVIYINNYYRYKISEEGNLKMKAEIPDILVLKF